MMDWGIRRSIMFHVRRRPADSQPRRRKKKPLGAANGANHMSGDREGPVLVEVTHSGDGGRRIKLGSDPVEVGSANTNCLQLFGPSIQPRHCLISLHEGVCTVTPLHTDALTFVNGHHISQPTILHNGSVVMFGRVASYRFLDSPTDGRYNLALSQSQLDSACLYERSPKLPGSSGLLAGAGGSGDGQGQEPILPAVLEFPETHQEHFLRHIISELDVNVPHFKLAPVYSLYLCARYRASTHYRPELQPTERAHKLTIFLHHVANLVYGVVQEQYTDPRILAFWMANSSEFLHFLKSDRHISAFSVQAQEVLAEAVQTAFRNLVNCFRLELSQTLNQFLSETIDHDSAAGLVLTVLGSAMALLRRCRVNAALTIQLFSQLFHYINVICFNTIVANSHMCTGEWGKVMTERLQLLELWAERQGLELAADCHLAKINQCAQFLQAPKSSVEEIQQLACSCFRLNSLQMGALLQQEKIPRNLVDTAIRMAESVADELTRADGREVRLEESPELHLALLLPDDGFSCDVVRGIPTGLVDFLNPLQQQGMCRLAAQPTSIGLWTVYMHQFNARSSSSMSNKLPQPEMQLIKLHKNSNGMGLSIVAAKGAGQERLGIYIKSVVPGGAADADGRLQAGDQLLRVDGQSLIGITQERAADYLVRTGPVVSLEVAKQGAIYHGLATLLQQPSPVIQRDTTSSNNYLQLQPQQQQQHSQQRRHSSYQQQARYYNNSISDDSLNRSRRESFACMRAASPPVRRLSASCLQEELCAMGHQLHIDPRYRDTRPIARSASSLYLEPTASYYQPPVVTQHFSPMRPLRRTPPPSIYIEEYMDEPPTIQVEAPEQRQSQESFTQFASYSDAHQPLNEESIASMADSGDIPFIDDEDDQQQQQQPSSSNNSFATATPSTMKRSPAAAGYRKTVSFDLEPPVPSVAASIDRKYHTHDAISNFANCNSSTESLEQQQQQQQQAERMPLIQKIRRELNTKRATNCSAVDYGSGGSGSNSQRSSSESIERMPLLQRPQQQQQLQQQSPCRRQLNTQRSHIRSGLFAPSTLPAPPPLVSIQVPNDSSCAPQQQHVYTSNQYCDSTTNTTSTSTTSSTTLKPSTNDSLSPSIYRRRASSHTTLSPSFQLPLGQGKVREIAAYFNTQPSFAPSKLKSKSTSALAAEKAQLTQNEQGDILKQLKEWSLFGSAGKDYNVQLPQQQQQQQSPLSCDCPCCAHCRGSNIQPELATTSSNNNNVASTFKCYDSCQAAITVKEPPLARHLQCRRSVMCNNRQAHSVRQLKRNKQQKQKQRKQQQQQQQQHLPHHHHHLHEHHHHRRRPPSSPPSTAKMLLSLASSSSNYDCNCSCSDNDNEDDNDSCTCSCSSSDCHCCPNNYDAAAVAAVARQRTTTNATTTATPTTSSLLICPTHR